MTQFTVVKLVDKGGHEDVIQGIHGFEKHEHAAQAVNILLKMFALDGDLQVIVEVESQ